MRGLSCLLPQLKLSLTYNFQNNLMVVQSLLSHVHIMVTVTLATRGQINQIHLGLGRQLEQLMLLVQGLRRVAGVLTALLYWALITLTG
nr:MAG TPA: hypothetical protein [Caudoviricetes sp.]